MINKNKKQKQKYSNFFVIKILFLKLNFIVKSDTVLKLKMGDTSAFEKVYNDFFKKIYQFVFFKVNNQSKAEDICSEVFLRFVKFVHNNEVDNVSAVLYKIARNLIIDDSRKNKEDLVGDEKMELIKDGDELNFDDKYINNEGLFLALSNLSDDYRDIIVMYYVNEMSLKDVAKVFGKTEGAAKTMLSRAMGQMREKLK